MDIRNFFGQGLSKNRSALTEVRESHGSPTKKSKKSTELAKTIKTNPAFTDSSSGEESPIPKSLRKTRSSIKKRRHITISSDEDDMRDSMSYQRPEKRSEKISDNIAAKRQRRNYKEGSVGHIQERKRPPKTAVVKSAKDSGDISDDGSDFVPAKKKYENIIPGQISSKLQKKKKVDKTNDDNENETKQSKLVKINPEEFFKNDGKHRTKEADTKQNCNVSPRMCKDIIVERNVFSAGKCEGGKKFLASLPWVDKYRPITIKQLVGQNGEKSPLHKLLGWLKDWSKYHLARPPPWMAQNDGTSFTAALLSGPPGIGKTTCALLACKELNLQYVEMNASDTRNKKLLDMRVAELLGSRQILQYFGKFADIAKANDSNEVTHVLIMDEVDGMNGNEDRAGLAELIQMIKETKVPIICICNDRQSPKMRTLVNYCFDIRFPRPRVEQIRPRIQTIVFQEKLNLSKEEVDEIIKASNHDVRQTICNLQLLSQGMDIDIQKKDIAMNLFEAARILLNRGTGILEKQRMFFVDYSMMPLFIQENYLLILSSKIHGKQRLHTMQKSAEAISNGDLIDKIIRNGGSWSLLNEQGLFSSVLPSIYMDGYMKSIINFPAWLGKNSSASKHQRLLQQIEWHTFHRISADRHSLVMEYVPVLKDALALPLIHKENEGVQEVIHVLDEYDLTRDDSDEIAELGTWPGLEDYRKKVQTKVKSALTRAYNKHSHLLPYALDSVNKKRCRVLVDVEYKLDEEGNLVEVDNEDKLNEDTDTDNEFSVVESKPKPSKAVRIREDRGTGRSCATIDTNKKAVLRGRRRAH